MLHSYEVRDKERETECVWGGGGKGGGRNGRRRERERKRDGEVGERDRVGRGGEGGEAWRRRTDCTDNLVVHKVKMCTYQVHLDILAKLSLCCHRNEMVVHLFVEQEHQMK